MKAWQLHHLGQPLELTEVDPPSPGAGEVVVRTGAAGVCHSDLAYISGDMQIGELPFTLGHEIAGVVDSVGDGVDVSLVGRRVAVNALVDGPGTSTDGGYAALVRVHARHLVPIPDGLDLAHAAVATDAGRTAMHAIRVLGPVRPGMRVGVIGLGGLGLLGAQAALHEGADVVAVEPREDSHEAARASGIRRIVTRGKDLADENLDAVIDFAGHGTTTNEAIAAVRAGGTVLQVGMAVASASIDLYDLTYREVTLRGVIVGDNDDIARAMALMATGSLTPVITRIGFDDLPEAHRRLEQGTAVGRQVIEMS